MPLRDLINELHARANASTRPKKGVCREPRRFSHIELESYLDHFKTCKLFHFPASHARYWRRFSRTCEIHADYVLSFEGIRMVEICCGEEIPYVDYCKLGDEEKSYIHQGVHIPGFRHIYLELQEAFRTSKQRPDPRNFSISCDNHEEAAERRRNEAAKAAKLFEEQTEIWAKILAKEYEKSLERRSDDSQDDEEEVKEDVNEQEDTTARYAFLATLVTRQRSETV